MVVQTQTEEVRRLRATNLELIFSRPQRLLPAALPEQVPEPHRHPGLPQGERRGELARVDPDLQADDPVPVRPRAGLPGAVRGALPARRGRRGDRDPGHASLRRRPGHQVDARRGHRPADPVRAPAEDRPPRRGHRVRAGRDGGRLLPADRRPRRDGLRARPGAGRDAPLRDPAVPPAEDRGPRGRVRVGQPARRQDRLRPGPRARLHARRPPEPGLRRGHGRDRLLRDEQARACPARTPPRSSTASSTSGPRRSACRIPATPASGSSSSAAASPRWTARGRRSARAPPR